MKTISAVLVLTVWWLSIGASPAFAQGDEAMMLKPPFKSMQFHDPTGSPSTVEEWLNNAEQRIVEIEKLKHEEELMRIQAEIGVHRKRCRDTGHDCPLTDYQPVAVADKHDTSLPEARGIIGGKVCFAQGKQCVWKNQGEVWRGFTIGEVGLDEVTVTAKDGRQFKLSPESWQ